MLDFWLSRWQNGQTGWHEADGNAALKKFWPALAAGSRVLVPLCGKSSDLAWLAGEGYEVTGVELSEIAARAFFEENDLQFETSAANGFNWYRNPEAGIAIACGNYFDFSDQPFDALYDRASLVAIPAKKRPEYIQKTKSLLKPTAVQLLVTLEYEQEKIEGPPFSVLPDEVQAYWQNLERVGHWDDLENSPPKFREAGLREMLEVVWVSQPGDPGM